MHAKPNPDGLRWDHTAAEIKDLYKKQIKEWNATMNEIVGFKGVRNFENTVHAISNLESDMELKSVQIVFYSSVAVNKEMRVAAKEYEKAISEYNLDLWMRLDVYHCFDTYKKIAFKDGSFAKLDKES